MTETRQQRSQRRAIRRLMGPRRYLALGAVLFGLISSNGLPLAAFSGCTNTGGSFSVAADFTPPVITSAVIVRNNGNVPGFVTQNSTMHVYANVSTDTGNPASGIAQVNANVGNFSSTTPNTILSAGSYSVGGTSYNYRTSSVVFTKPTIAAGSYGFTLFATDADNNSSSLNSTASVDNTAPAGSNVQTQNGSSPNATCTMEQGDKIIYSYNEAMDPSSMGNTSWFGTSTNVVVRMNNNGANDQIEIWNPANTSQLRHGIISVGYNISTGDRTFGASGTPSTMVMSDPAALGGGIITVTLGTRSGSVQTGTAAVAISWTPNSYIGATDRAGNSLSTTTVTEDGISDCEF